MLILLLGLVACADAGDPTNPEFQSSSVVALGLWPQDPTIAVGDSLDFVAFGLTAAGDTVALDVTWSASGGEIRGNGKGKGRYNARAAGRNKVKATSDSLSDSTTVTVTDVPVASVAVTPATATVEVSNTVQLTATLRDAAGNALTGRVVSWTTNDATCAVVNANGRVSAVGAGTATITATSEGKSGAASVTVSQASGSALPGDVGDLAVVGQAETALTLALTEVDDGEGNPASYAVRFAPSPISWGGAAGSEFVVAGVQVGATLEFQVSGLASGTQYDVQSVAFRGALGQDAVFSESLSNVATGVTQTNTAAVASVDVTPATASVNEGSTVPLTATVRDAAGTVLTGRAVSWASSNTSVASVNGSGLVSGVAAGAATITATSEGHTGSATISVTPDTTDPGALAVTTSTIGSDLDLDGYRVTIDASSSQSIGINDRVTFNDLAAGDHEVLLSGIASNCSVDGNPRTVTVSSGGTAEITFSLTCSGGSGAQPDIYEWDFESPENGHFGKWIPPDNIQALDTPGEAAQGQWYASTYNWGHVPWNEIRRPYWLYSHSKNEGPQDNVYLRFRFKIKSERTPDPFPWMPAANPKLVRFVGSGNVTLGYLLMMRDGKLRFSHELGSGPVVTSSSQHVFNDTWQWIEVFFECNRGGKPRARIWVDGVLALDLTANSSNTSNQRVSHTRLLWAGGQPDERDEMDYNLHLLFDQTALATFRLGIP